MQVFYRVSRPWQILELTTFFIQYYYNFQIALQCPAWFLQGYLKTNGAQTRAIFCFVCRFFLRTHDEDVKTFVRLGVKCTLLFLQKLGVFYWLLAMVICWLTHIYSKGTLIDDSITEKSNPPQDEPPAHLYPSVRVLDTKYWNTVSPTILAFFLVILFQEEENSDFNF